MLFVGTKMVGQKFISLSSFVAVVGSGINIPDPQHWKKLVV
jgi:hypothetical protein